MIRRRGFIAGLGALLAAPAVVRAGSLMPVRRVPLLSAEMVTARTMRILAEINEQRMYLLANPPLFVEPLWTIPGGATLVQWGETSTQYHRIA